MKGKIVLLGFLGSSLGQLTLEDLYFTPMNPYYVGRSFPDSYGIIIHSNIISQILEERYIDALPEKLGWLVNFLILCFFTALLAYFYTRYHENYAILSKISAFLSINFLLFFALYFYKYFSFKFDFRLALFYLVFLPDGYEYYHRYLLPNFYWLLERIKWTK